MAEITRSSEKPLPSLPPELILLIFLKLPVKSLLRFKCLSISWRSRISEPQFLKAHLNESLTSPRRNMLTIKYNRKDHLYHLFTANLPAFNNHIVPQELDYVTDILAHDLPPPHHYSPEVIGSCNGLICLMYADLLYVSNVSIRVTKRIPSLSRRSYFNMHGFGYDHSGDDYMHGFGYDHSRDDYIVLGGNDSGIHMYSLRSESWKRLSTHDFDMNGYFRHHESTQVNGAMHWLIYSNGATKSNQTLRIVAFDLVDERFREIPMPDLSAVGFKPWAIKLSVLRECLCIVPKPIFDGNILVMNEYGVEQSWTKLEIKIPGVVALLNNDLVLIKIDGKKFVSYNTRVGTYRYLLCDNAWDFIFPDSYVNTFVSPIMDGANVKNE